MGGHSLLRCFGFMLDRIFNCRDRLFGLFLASDVLNPLQKPREPCKLTFLYLSMLCSPGTGVNLSVLRRPGAGVFGMFAPVSLSVFGMFAAMSLSVSVMTLAVIGGLGLLTRSTTGLLCGGCLGTLSFGLLTCSTTGLLCGGCLGTLSFGFLTFSTAGLLCRRSLWALSFFCGCRLGTFGLLYFGLGLTGTAALFLLGGHNAR